MPRKTCCVFGCPHTTWSTPTMTYFRLPKDEDRRFLWLQLINREELMVKNPHHYVVCEVHFEPHCIMINSNRKLLKKTALPSLVLPKTPKNQSGVSVMKFKVPVRDVSTQTSKSRSLIKVCKKEVEEDQDVCKGRLNIKDSKKRRIELFHRLCDKLLSGELGDLVKTQSHLRLHKEGTECPVKFELFCTHLYYASPRAYKLYQQPLSVPSPNTLMKPILPATTHVNDRLMVTFKAKVDNMSNSERICSVVIAAVSLKPNLFFNIGLDKIIGFHEVEGVQAPVPARSALVVAVQGILDEWMQPIGFALLQECKEDENVTQFVDKILKELFDIGLDIRTFVTDQELDQLNEAKRLSVSIEKPYFSIKGRKIYYVYDTPHMMKLVLSNFMLHDFKFQSSVGKWKHILQFYESDKNKSRKLAPRLTESHIKFKKNKEIKVCHATQVFSRSVSTGISTYVDFQAIDESAMQTVELVSLINDLFDILNSSKKSSEIEYKKAFCGSESQTFFLNKVLDMLSSLKIVDPKNGTDVTSNANFIEGFQITIRSIMHFFDDLKNEGYNLLPTRRLNQDVIKTFFGKLPTKNGSTSKPTTRQFTAAFQDFVFSNIVQPPKLDNCSDDLEHLLLNTKKLESLVCNVSLDKIEINFDEVTVKIEPYTEPTEIDVKALNISRGDYDQLDMPENDPLIYICGYLLKKSLEQDSFCQLLRSYVESGERVQGDRYILVPPDDFVTFVKEMEARFSMFFGANVIGGKVFKTLFENISYIEFGAPCPCFPTKYIKVLYIRMRLYHLIKFNNKAFRKNQLLKKCLLVPV